MPTCLKCSSHFPNFQMIEGKRRNLCNRKFCIECSPFKGNNRVDLRESPLLREERKKIRIQKAIESVVRRRKEIMRLAIEYKGGKCLICGYNRCVRALEFHHVDPSQKEFGISAKGYTRAWDKVKKELDKCVLLCANCHREVEDGMTDLTPYINL